MEKLRINETMIERENGTRRIRIDCGGESKTEQSHRDKCNINTIMKKANIQGLTPEQISRKENATYGDFSKAEDFHSMNNRIIKAKEEFQLLPSAIRNRFSNDPGKLIEFLSDPRNKKEAQELGIMKKDVYVEPVKQEQVSEKQSETEKAAKDS